MKLKLICALSLNIVLASALNAKSIEDIAADRGDIQNIYNIYNNEICAESNSLMKALNSFSDNAKDCVADILSNLDKATTLTADIDKFDRNLKAFKLSYKDINEDYKRQVKMLNLLEKVKEIDADRVQYARNLLKNIKLEDASSLKFLQELEASLDRIESFYSSLYQNIATNSTSFSLVNPQIAGIETSLKSLENFFAVAKDNLKQARLSLDEYEPKVAELYEQYQMYLDNIVADYKEISILSEDILEKVLESFYDIKDNFAFTNAEDFVFDSYKNLRLNNLSKPKDLIKISKTNVNYLGLKGKALVSPLKEASVDETWQLASSPAGFSTTRVAMSTPAKQMDDTIKELRLVNAIISDLKDNYEAANAVLVNVSSLSATIKTMSNKSVSMLKEALKLSTDSQVLLTNVDIFKGEFDIKSRQANIAIDNIEKSSKKIKSSKTKIKELL